MNRTFDLGIVGDGNCLVGQIDGGRFTLVEFDGTRLVSCNETGGLDDRTGFESADCDGGKEGSEEEVVAW